MLNAAGLSWGWFQGGFRPTTSFATATAAPSRPAPSSPTSSRASSPMRRRPTRACATPSTRSARPSAAPAEPVAGGTNYGNKDDYIAHHEPFQYYASTANPHHLPPASLSAIGTDTQTITAGTPQFDTANHQYDMSDFDALVGAISHGYLVGGPPARGELPEGTRIPGRTRRLLRPVSTSSNSSRPRSTTCSTLRTGRAPPSSSPTTTPTAGTTTSTAGSTTRRTRPRWRPHPARRTSSPARACAATRPRSHRWPGRAAAAGTVRGCRCW